MGQSIDMFTDFKGNFKELFIVRGGHNARRPLMILKQIVRQLENAIDLVLLEEKIRDGFIF